MIFKAKNFMVCELVHPELYSKMVSEGWITPILKNGKIKAETIGHKRIYRYVEKIAQTAQYVRDLAKEPCIVNNWHVNKAIVKAVVFLSDASLKGVLLKRDKNIIFCYSGTRPIDCLEGAKFSTHKDKDTGTVDIRPISYGADLVKYDLLRHAIWSDGELNLSLEVEVKWIHATQYFENKIKFKSNGEIVL